MWRGSYSERARKYLLVLEERQRDYERWLREHPEYPHKDRKLVPPLDLEDEIEGLADIVIVFSCMAVESFLNGYGVTRLGEAFYVQYYERLSIHQKLAALLATCDGILVDKSDEIVTTVRRLFDRRNRLVHPKTREYRSGKSFEGLLRPSLVQEARDSITERDRIQQLFLEYNPEIFGPLLRR